MCGVIYTKQRGEFFELIEIWPQSAKTQSAGAQCAGFMGNTKYGLWTIGIYNDNTNT